MDPDEFDKMSVEPTNKFFEEEESEPEIGTDKELSRLSRFLPSITYAPDDSSEIEENTETKFKIDASKFFKK